MMGAGTSATRTAWLSSLRSIFITVVMVVGFGAAFGGFVTPQAAYAYSNAAPPIDSPAFEQGLRWLVDGGSTTPPTGIPPLAAAIPDWEGSDLYVGAVAAADAPMVLTALAGITLTVAGIDLGWKITHGGSSPSWLHLFGPTGAPPPNGLDFNTGHPSYQTITLPGGLEGQTLPYGVAVTWSGMEDTACQATIPSGMGSWRGFDLWPTSDGNAVGGTKTCLDELIAMENVIAGEGYTATPFTVGPCFSSGSLTGINCVFLTKTEATLEQQLVHGAPVPFTSQRAGVTTDMPTSGCTTVPLPCSPSGSWNETQANAARAALHAAPDVGTAGMVNCQLDPADFVCPTGPTDPGYQKQSDTGVLELPMPQEGETASAYRQRLRDQGYLGNVWIEDDPLFDTSTVPGTVGVTSPVVIDPVTGECVMTCLPIMVAVPYSITRVGVGKVSIGTATSIYDGATGQWDPWPENPPTYSPKTTEDITIWRVPGPYVPPTNPPTQPKPPDQPPPTGGTPGSGGAIDLTPLTSLSPGCSFPFGIFCYAKSVTDDFNVSPQAPDFSIALPAVDAAGHHYASPGNWDVNLDQPWLNGYMSDIRTIEAAVLWIGATFFLASRLFGFEAGDPTDALGEAHGEWI